MKLRIKQIFASVLFVLISLSQTVKADDQNDLSLLADGFATAMAKKDKVWMEANLSESCITYVPSGESLDRSTTLKAFTGMIYNINKASAANKSFMVAGNEAGGSADYTVEGTANAGSEVMDIAGTYKLSFKFKKTEKGWSISEILVNGN